MVKGICSTIKTVNTTGEVKAGVSETKGEGGRPI
jgi:hypothetical protein